MFQSSLEFVALEVNNRPAFLVGLYLLDNLTICQYQAVKPVHIPGGVQNLFPVDAHGRRPCRRIEKFGRLLIKFISLVSVHNLSLKVPGGRKVGTPTAGRNN